MTPITETEKKAKQATYNAERQKKRDAERAAREARDLERHQIDAIMRGPGTYGERLARLRDDQLAFLLFHDSDIDREGTAYPVICEFSQRWRAAGEEITRLRDRVRVLEKQRDREVAALKEFPSPTKDVGAVSLELDRAG